MGFEYKAILLKFPELKEMILQQFENNDDFASLCFDYQLCIDTIRLLETDMISNTNKINEFSDLKKELEMEALKYLVHNNNNKH